MTAFDNKYISKVAKKEILLLPSFENKRNELNGELRKMN